MEATTEEQVADVMQQVAHDESAPAIEGVHAAPPGRRSRSSAKTVSTLGAADEEVDSYLPRSFVCFTCRGYNGIALTLLSIASFCHFISILCWQGHLNVTETWWTGATYASKEYSYPLSYGRVVLGGSVENSDSDAEYGSQLDFMQQRNFYETRVSELYGIDSAGAQYVAEHLDSYWFEKQIGTKQNDGDEVCATATGLFFAGFVFDILCTAFIALAMWKNYHPKDDVETPNSHRSKIAVAVLTVLLLGGFACAVASLGSWQRCWDKVELAFKYHIKETTTKCDKNLNAAWCTELGMGTEEYTTASTTWTWGKNCPAGGYKCTHITSVNGAEPDAGYIFQCLACTFMILGTVVAVVAAFHPPDWGPTQEDAYDFPATGNNQPGFGTSPAFQQTGGVMDHYDYYPAQEGSRRASQRYEPGRASSAGRKSRSPRNRAQEMELFPQHAAVRANSSQFR